MRFSYKVVGKIIKKEAYFSALGLINWQQIHLELVRESFKIDAIKRKHSWEVGGGEGRRERDGERER